MRPFFMHSRIVLTALRFTTVRQAVPNHGLLVFVVKLATNAICGVKPE